EGGIYKSTDGGEHWTKTAELFGYALIFDPNNPTTLYAATNAGAQHSTNNGDTWESLGLRFPGSRFIPRGFDIAATRTNPTTLFVGTDQGVARSTNGSGGIVIGAWSLVLNQLAYSVAIDPVDPNVVYVGASV